MFSKPFVIFIFFSLTKKIVLKYANSKRNFMLMRVFQEFFAVLYDSYTYTYFVEDDIFLIDVYLIIKILENCVMWIQKFSRDDFFTFFKTFF